MSTDYETIMACAARDWEDNGQTIEQAVCEWANCRHAEVHEMTGEVYVEDPQDGRYLGDADLAKLVSWMRQRGMIDAEAQR